MTGPIREDRALGACPACFDVPGFTPECAVCGGAGLVPTTIAWFDAWRLRPTIDPDRVRMVRKDPAERNRAKAARRRKRGKR